MNRSLRFLLTAAALASASPAFAEVPNVVASIKPVHSLVAAVMEGLGEPDLLLDSIASPHTYAMRPSDASMLSGAAVVFWIGPGLESFLVDALPQLSGGAEIVELAGLADLHLLPNRAGGLFGADEQAEEHVEDHGDHPEDEAAGGEAGHEHAEEGIDMHFWLDPENGKVIVQAVAEKLAALDPDNAARYRENARREVERIEAVAAEAKTLLAPEAGKGFVVTHDAFQYFEEAFGPEAVASVTINPEVAPGARRIADIQEKIAETGTSCLVTEPQFPAKIVDVLATADTRTASLDPVGVDIAKGPGLYTELLRSNAEALKACLSGE